MITIKILNEGFKKKLNESRNREVQDIMDKIEQIRETYWNDPKIEVIDQILDSHNASQDDSGPEGFYVTMSDEDIIDSYNEISQLFPHDEDLIKLIVHILSDAGVNCPSFSSDGFEVLSGAAIYKFNLEKVELDDLDIEYTDDDFEDWK